MTINDLESLAERFKGHLASSERSIWMAGIEAFKAREAFVATPKIGRWSWSEFCMSPIGFDRDVDTVGAYIRAVRYCMKHVKGFDAKSVAKANLPSISLVAELAGAPGDKREELHLALWSGKFSASEFRQMLSQAKAVRSQMNLDHVTDAVETAGFDTDEPSEPAPPETYEFKLGKTSASFAFSSAPQTSLLFSALKDEQRDLDEAFSKLPDGAEFTIRIVKGVK